MRNKDQYIQKWLTYDEKTIIDKTEGMDSSDYIILAKVKHIMSLEHLANIFDNCIPIDRSHYLKTQRRWMEVEQWIIGQQIDPTLPKDQQESQKTERMIQDFENNRNGLRFKIFYCLKYPNLVKRSQKELSVIIINYEI